MIIIIIVLSSRIHIAKYMPEPPQRNAERKDPSLSPVDNPCYMPSIGIHKDIYLAEIAITQD